MSTNNSTPQTYTHQLFGELGNKILWAFLLALLIIGLIGTIWDLSEADVLGTGGLDSGTAAWLIIVPVAVMLVIALVTWFHGEMRAKRKGLVDTRTSDQANGDVR